MPPAEAPKDLNLYQGVKSLLNGVNALKRGGTFVFLCECPEGGGAPDFFDWTKPLSQGRLDPALQGSLHHRRVYLLCLLQIHPL